MKSRPFKIVVSKYEPSKKANRIRMRWMQIKTLWMDGCMHAYVDACMNA